MEEPGHSQGGDRGDARGNVFGGIGLGADRLSQLRNPFVTKGDVVLLPLAHHKH